MKRFSSRLTFFFLGTLLTVSSALGEDYFKKYAGGIPVEVKYLKSLVKKSMVLQGLDTQKGIIYAKMDQGGTIEMQLRDLRK